MRTEEETREYLADRRKARDENTLEIKRRYDSNYAGSSYLRFEEIVLDREIALLLWMLNE